MREKTLNLLGLMRRANAIAVGETASGAAVRGGKAKLLLLASDASDNARRRAEGFVYGRSTPLLPIPFAKEELSSHLGLPGCSMAAVTDIGFANALMKSLAAQWPDEFSALAEETERRNSKAQKRKSAKARLQPMRGTRGTVKGGAYEYG